MMWYPDTEARLADMKSQSRSCRTQSDPGNPIHEHSCVLHNDDSLRASLACIVVAPTAVFTLLIDYF